MLKNETVTALLVHIVVILCAKFEISSFNRSRDIRGDKIKKVGHVTPNAPSVLREILGGPKIPKVFHVTSHDPF